MHGAVEQKLKRGREVEDEAELSGATLSLNGDRIVDDESAIATCPSSTFSSQIILVSVTMGRVRPIHIQAQVSFCISMKKSRYVT